MSASDDDMFVFLSSSMTDARKLRSATKSRSGERGISMRGESFLFGYNLINNGTSAIDIIEKREYDE
jgi:hypothetical protein